MTWTISMKHCSHSFLERRENSSVQTQSKIMGTTAKENFCILWSISTQSTARLPLSKLKLKVGCPIMVLRNLNPGGGVCNGTRAVVTRMSDRVLEARLLTGEHAGSTTFIPRLSIIPSNTQVPFDFCRRQFPVKVCFAMSINKSQGQSVDHVGLDFRNAVFTHGQLYVAISRVTSVHNIKAIWDPRFAQPVTKNIVYPEVIID